MVQIFLAIKSPNEQAITKQACRDESSLCFFPPIATYIVLCSYVSSTIKRKNQ